MRRSVVLPAPLRPAIVSRSRRSSLNDTPRSRGSPAMSLARSDAMRTATRLAYERTLDLSAQERGQLGAPAEVELAVDLAQVVLDGLRAHEQRRGRLLVRRALGHDHRDLQLVRREHLGDRQAPAARRRAAGPQLRPGALGPPASP